VARGLERFVGSDNALWRLSAAIWTGVFIYAPHDGKMAERFQLRISANQNPSIL